MSTIGFISLGCPKNQIDGECLLALLDEAGFEITDPYDGVDAVIINTCGFIESAKKEAIENILDMAELKAEGTVGRIIVTGCLAERYKEEMFANTELEIKNKGKILGLSLASNLPYYFIYFALSLLPFDFAALWIVAGLPCCFIAGLRPINQNYQRYNLLTNKGKLYWFIQFVLAAVLWIGGRMIITLLVLGK